MQLIFGIVHRPFDTNRANSLTFLAPKKVAPVVHGRGFIHRGDLTQLDTQCSGYTGIAATVQVLRRLYRYCGDCAALNYCRVNGGDL